MRKKFIKVVLFGALTLAAGASFVGCKDYDDDVKNLQEQIDKITSTSPVSTEDMKAAIVAAKAELQAEVDKLKASAADKTAIAALETKIAELKTALEKADSEAAAKIAADLAIAKNELKDLIGGNTDRIAALEGQISKLAGIETRLADLEAAQSDYLKTGDLNAYTKTADMAALINSEIAKSLGSDESIAAYVKNAINTQALTEASALSVAIAAITGEHGSLTKLQDAFTKAMEDDETGVLKRLNELELYNQGINNAIANSKGEYENFADVLASLDQLKADYAALVVPKEFAAKVDAALTESLKDANSEFSKLTEKVEQLGIDIDAIKAMIQSVVFVPEFADGQVQFTSLYVLKNQTAVAWQSISKSDAVQVKFRISPVTAAAKFLENYTMSLDAQEIKTRAGGAFDIVEDGTTVDATTGMVTIKLKANTDKSYAVSLNIKSKASDKTGVATDINSNYFPVISIENYLHSAFYKLTADNKTIIYDDATSKADYSTGKVYVSVSTDGDVANATDKEFSSLGVSNIFGTEFSATNAPIFQISAAGVVSLKSYGQASSVNEASTVSAIVKLTDANYKMTPDAKTLGTVIVKKATLGKDVNFGTIQTEWKNTITTIVATNFDVKTICDQNGITKNEFASLTGTVVTGDVQFAVGIDNALTATVAAGKKAGEYPIEVSFANADNSLVFKVKATVKVVYPNVVTLTPNADFWEGTPADGTAGLTPTLNDNAKPSSIGLTYDLTTLFSNYAEVKAAIPAGGSLTISVADVAQIPGLSYNSATSKLTYDKDAFTGYLADGETKAVVKVKAVVTLGAEAIQTLNATINIINISGSWVAPATKAVTLTDKAAIVDLSKGFQWNDLRGKAMWKDAATTVGGNDFAASTNALALYGLDVPTFILFDKATNMQITSEYLTLAPATGKISFTQAGKDFNFIRDYVITVKVVAGSQWGAIKNYAGNEYITVTIPKN